MTVPATISHSVQLTQVWLKEIRDTAGLDDEQQAWSVLRAVLHQLRDRLTLDEAVQLSAQLPLVVRGLYFEGWQPRHAGETRVHSQEEFLDGVSERLTPSAAPPERLVRSVFATLAHHVDPGEVADVIGQLPTGMKGLWPLAARTFRERMR